MEPPTYFLLPPPNPPHLSTIITSSTQNSELPPSIINHQRPPTPRPTALYHTHILPPPPPPQFPGATAIVFEKSFEPFFLTKRDDPRTPQGSTQIIIQHLKEQNDRLKREANKYKELWNKVNL